MTHGSKNRLNTKFMHALYGIGVTAGLSDGELLDRFLFGRDGVNEVAFAALMERHGPMVFQVCRQVLGNSHDAQDAFQATFFVLIRKAESIRRCDSLGSWLYGVARRVAMRANADAARRRTHERQAAARRAPASGDEVDQPDSWAELHEQIDRMPEKYREPVVLCYLEGLSTDAAARRIGCPKGTVLSRLARARQRLRVGLASRNLSLSAIPLAEAMRSGRAKPSALAELFEGTIRASLRFAEQPATVTGSSSAAAVALANGVIRAMTMTKLKICGAAMIACAMLTGVAHTIGRQLAGGGEVATPGAAQSGTEKRPDGISSHPGMNHAEAEDRPARTTAFNSAYILWQPYTFQDNAPYGLKSQYSWALGMTVPLPIYNRNQGGNQREQPLSVRPVDARKAPLFDRNYAGAGFNEDANLEDGVKRFNERTKELGVGLDEPPLTKDEVIAAIRGWIPKQNPVEPVMLESFQRVAETGVLPAGSSFTFTTRWTGYNGYAFDVWWVDLNMPEIANDEDLPGQQRPVGYTYRIRARTLSSRPLAEQQEIERRERGRRRLERLKLEKKSNAPKQQ